ncbi:MAG: hypothetical protein QME68_03085 [Elusimicrobiota bacterium]|nr:hypothetical protein [Elusimicrobiota bacterium]
MKIHHSLQFTVYSLQFALCVSLFSLFSLFFALLSGCATTRVGLKLGYDFSKVRSVGIGSFVPFGEYKTSSEFVADEFARLLMQNGYIVKRNEEGVDVVLEGSITQFAPSRKFLFYTTEPLEVDKEKKVVVVTPQMLEIGGSNVYSLGYAFGLGRNAQILISNATVGITARLIDTSTREIVWTNSFTYEGLDIQSATETAVRYLVKSIIKGK